MINCLKYQDIMVLYSRSILLQVELNNHPIKQEYMIILKSHSCTNSKQLLIQH